MMIHKRDLRFQGYYTEGWLKRQLRGTIYKISLRDHLQCQVSPGGYMRLLLGGSVFDSGRDANQGGDL